MQNLTMTYIISEKLYFFGTELTFGNGIVFQNRTGAMKKELYEFIFDLRASGFMHHTLDDFYLPGRERNPDVLLDPENNFRAGDGERGVLSANVLRDLRYFIVGCCFSASSYEVEQGGNAEYAYGISDYFINEVDQAKTVDEFSAIFHEMIRTFMELDESRKKEAEQKIRSRAVRKAMRYIQQHLYSRISAQEVAGYVGLDQSYLSSLFSRETGSTLKRYILIQKTEEAGIMLTQTDREIRQIGEALGFSSAPHFTRAFTGICGITPSEYRRERKKNQVKD